MITFHIEMLELPKFVLKKPRASKIADIIQIATIFIKKPLNTHKKIFKNQKVCIKMQSISVLLNITKHC